MPKSKYKPGLYKWKRIPAEETQGRYHTSLVKVFADSLNPAAKRHSLYPDAVIKVELEDGTLQWARRGDLTGPFDPKTGRLMTLMDRVWTKLGRKQ